MKVRKILSIAIVSVLLAACSSSSGGGNAIRPSVDQLPEQERKIVIEEKTIDLLEENANSDYSRQTTLDGKTDTYNFSDLANGRTDLRISRSYKDGQETTNYSGTLLVYQQPYSVVTGVTWTTGSGSRVEDDYLNVFYGDITVGLATPTSAVTELRTQNAIFDYTGVAFDGGNEQGILNYTVNFGTQEGQGSITGFSHTGRIDLQAEQLRQDIDESWFINGDAYIEKAPSDKQQARYLLSFFGPNAEEVAGEVYELMDGGFLGYSGIIFAGERD